MMRPLGEVLGEILNYIVPENSLSWVIAEMHECSRSQGGCSIQSMYLHLPTPKGIPRDEGNNWLHVD